MTRRVFLALAMVLSLSVVVAPRAATRGVDVPARLTDAQFWQTIEDFSEPGGSFRSDNLLSNEIWFQYIIPDLKAYLKPGGVYLGVGPEQNFTYIAALQPKMVIIFDIRRGNLHTHLMYKAIFEMAADRSDFVSLLFSRKKPQGLGPKSTVQELFAGISAVPPDEDLYQANYKRLTDHLTRARKLPLPQDDLDGIEYVYRNFQRFGSAITYNSSTGGGGGRNAATYATLMTADDGRGEARSFLATEALFGVLKDLHTRNLVIPVVGDFAGPKAIRAVGRYLKAQGATVTAFYLSNVEQYLTQNGVWQAFCQNFATLPLTEESTFIFSQGGGGGRGGGRGGGLDSYYRRMLQDVKTNGCAGGRP